MKKLTLILFVLLPFLLLSQTQTENYIKSTIYLNQYKGAFNNYPSQSIGITDLIYTTNGGAGGSISITNNILTVSFSGSWSQQPMKLGVIKTLAVTPVLPKIELGPILSAGNQTGYFAKIENNNLIFYSPYFLNGTSTNIFAAISGGAPGVNYSVSTGNLYACSTSGSGGNSGTITINNGVATLSMGGGWSSGCNLKLGQIVQLVTSTIPNTELGIIKDQNGLETTYRAKIENNWLVFYASQAIPALPNTGSLSFTLNLGIGKQEKLENITYLDGLGRAKQNIALGQGPNKVNNNLLDWKNSWALGSGSANPFYIQNGATTENVRVNGTNPFGKTEMLWQCVNDAVSDADGGWNSALISIDKTASYRYAVWVKRTGSQDGTTYHGVQNVVNLDGTANTNPYFWSGDLPALDTWYLMVGMIHPATYGGGYSGISGVYDTAGNKVISGTDFKWGSSTVDAYFRSYLYYATDVNVRQYFNSPIVQKIDETEASVAGLVAGFDPSDIVTYIKYDNYGRKEKEYLPYATPNVGNGDIKTNPLTAVLGFYYKPKYENTANPFSQKDFEKSPLNRVLKQAAPGNDWVLNSPGDDHSIKVAYQTNALNEVKLYTVTTSLDSNGVYNPTITSTTNYPSGQLYKTVTKDENWIATDLNNKTTEEFKDREGHIVLKKTYGVSMVNDVAVNTAHQTYYVYDNYGNLTYVLPPKAEGLIDIATLNNLCFQYKYDYRNRLVEKKLPGKEWEYIVYDKLDRPILTQDVNLRTSNKWLFTKYDAFNRPVYTGEYINASQITRATVQTLANGVVTLSETKQGVNTINGTTVYYSNSAFPNINNTNINLYTINYYDDYSFDLNGGASTTSYGITPITNAESLPTGSKIRVIGALSPNNWITNVIYYDVKGRSIFNYSKNDYLSTTDKVLSQLDFAGKVLETSTTHLRTNVTPNVSVQVVDTYTYDHAGRLLAQKQKINSQADEIIVANTYDNLGQLTSKGVGGKMTQKRLQKVDYTYNIRGWLKSINDVSAIGSDLFAFQINYNTPTVGKLYNGNISQTLWKTAYDPIGNSPRTYSYAYDALNRLTVATDNTSLTPNRYNESIAYDKNGNIETLFRKGHTNSLADSFGTMDDLVYTYDAGNRLTKVVDNSLVAEGFNNGNSTTLTDYTYDNNGNMLTDSNKALSAMYNYLNLPVQVTIGGQNINYVYDATGTKLKKTVNGVTTDYAGGYIYENDKLQFFSQPEGYLANNNGIYSYIYQFKDHLGNVRLSYGDGNNNGVITASTDSSTNEIVEENNYYPFGLKHEGYNRSNGSLGNAVAQKYDFNGKEEQAELGLNITAMDFRMYDNALGRFYGLDALAELTPSITPNHFGYNNPVFWADPSGLLSQSFLNTIWENSPAGKDTNWVNDGFGNFDKSGSNGVVNSNGEYHEGSGKGEILPNVTIISGIGDKRNQDRIRGNAYLNGRFYKHWRDKQTTKKWDELQSGLDVVGTIPFFGEFIDGGNGLISLVRGDYAGAGLSASAMVPFLGWGATGVKLTGKAHTVYTGVKKGIPYVGMTSDLSKRYSADEIRKYGITALLENVPGRDMARGIEQTLINHHGLENLSNEINSISKLNQEGKHSGTMEKAVQYLNANLPGWNK